MKTNNNFQISGFVVNDATINQFAKASVARFGLSIGRLEKNGEKDSRVSAIMNIEAWKSNEASDALNIITKGKRIAVEGYFKPEEYTDKDGVKHNTVKLVATKLAEVQKEQEDEPSEEKPKETKKKGKKAK